MMKNIIPIILISIFLSSCGSKAKTEDDIKLKINNFIFENAENTSGYEFVSYTLIDTITVYENIDFCINRLKNTIISEKKNIKDISDYYGSPLNKEQQGNVDGNLKTIKTIKELIDKLDQTKLETQDKELAYAAVAKYRIEGQLLEAYFNIDILDNSIMDATGDIESYNRVPGGFPGFENFKLKIKDIYLFGRDQFFCKTSENWWNARS